MRNTFYIFFLMCIILFSGCKTNSDNPISGGNYLNNDFFPLKVGNEWKFNYDLTNRFSTEMYEAKGTLEWTIVNSKSGTDFELQSILNVTRNYFVTGRDSVVMPPDTVNFDVVQGPNGLISFTDPHLLVDIISFNRFNESFSDSGSVDLSTPQNDDEVVVSMKKNIGIVKFDMYHSHNSAPTGEISIIKYTILNN